MATDQLLVVSLHSECWLHSRSMVFRVVSLNMNEGGELR